MEMEQFEEAQQLLRSCLSIKRENLPKDHIDLAKCKLNSCVIVEMFHDN